MFGGDNVDPHKRLFCTESPARDRRRKGKFPKKVISNSCEEIATPVANKTGDNISDSELTNDAISSRTKKTMKKCRGRDEISDTGDVVQDSKRYDVEYFVKISPVCVDEEQPSETKKKKKQKHMVRDEISRADDVQNCDESQSAEYSKKNPVRSDKMTCKKRKTKKGTGCGDAVSEAGNVVQQSESECAEHSESLPVNVDEMPSKRKKKKKKHRVAAPDNDSTAPNSDLDRVERLESFPVSETITVGVKSDKTVSLSNINGTHTMAEDAETHSKTNTKRKHEERDATSATVNAVEGSGKFADENRLPAPFRNGKRKRKNEKKSTVAVDEVRRKRKKSGNAKVAGKTVALPNSATEQRDVGSSQEQRELNSTDSGDVKAQMTGLADKLSTVKKPVRFAEILHDHERSLSSHRKAVCAKALDKKGVKLKTGRWSAKENKQLMENWEQYRIMKEIGEMDFPIWNAMKKKDKTKLVKALGNGICRRLLAVYEKARYVFRNSNAETKGSFTKKEEKKLKRLRETEHFHWDFISEAMQRSVGALKYKWARMQEKTSAVCGEWTSAEDTALWSAVESSELDPADVGYWLKVAANVQNRRPEQCRRRWQLLSINEQKDPRKITTKDRLCLLESIIDMNLCDGGSIDWTLIMTKFDGNITRHNLQNCFARMKKKSGHKDDRRELVRYLKKVELPKLKKMVEKEELHLLSQV